MAPPKLTNQISAGNVIQLLAMLGTVGLAVAYTTFQSDATAEDVTHLTTKQSHLSERVRLIENITAANAVRHEAIKKDITDIKTGQKDTQELLLQLLKKRD